MAPTTSDTPQAGRPGPVLRRVVYEPRPEQVTGSVPVESVVDDATRVRITRLVVVLLELLDGRRPAAAAAAVGSPQVVRYLAAYGRRRAVSASRALSVRIYQPRTGSAEVAAVCVIDRTIRAVALRIDRDEHPFSDHQGRGHEWRVTALRVL